MRFIWPKKHSGLVFISASIDIFARAPSVPRGSAMLDLLLLLIGCGFFAASIAYVYFCEKV
jgi:hypothetical protein